MSKWWQCFTLGWTISLTGQGGNLRDFFYVRDHAVGLWEGINQGCHWLLQPLASVYRSPHLHKIQRENCMAPTPTRASASLQSWSTSTPPSEVLSHTIPRGVLLDALTIVLSNLWMCLLEAHITMASVICNIKQICVDSQRRILLFRGCSFMSMRLDGLLKFYLRIHFRYFP